MNSHHTPTKTDIETGTYALAIHEGGQDLFQYEKPSPWEDPEWIERRQYEHGDVPPLNLKETQVEQQTNGGNLQSVTLYAAELDANPQQSTDSGGQDSDESHQGYAIRFSDGEVIPEKGQKVHTTQEENMGEAVDYLVREHELIDTIDLPYLPPRARQNCSINTQPIHPTGEDMRAPYEMTGGYFLHTSLNRQSKMNRIEDLAGKVGLSVEFLGDW